MEIIDVKRQAILLDEYEKKKLILLVGRGAMHLDDTLEDDLAKFAEYFTIKLKEL